MFTCGNPLVVGSTCGRCAPEAVGSATIAESPAKLDDKTVNAANNDSDRNVFLNMAMTSFIYLLDYLDLFCF
jgi:hypothetical protein